MKKLSVLFLAVLTLFCICGCTEDYNTSTETFTTSKNESIISTPSVEITLKDESSPEQAEKEETSSAEETPAKSEITQQIQPNQAENSSTKSSKVTSSQQQTTSSQKQTTSSVNNPKTTGDTVYSTPTGKRYHRDPDCGGKNSQPININDAIREGLTPCQKCAQ